jgi:hypothetical protein
MLGPFDAARATPFDTARAASGEAHLKIHGAPTTFSSAMLVKALPLTSLLEMKRM